MKLKILTVSPYVDGTVEIKVDGIVEIKVDGIVETGPSNKSFALFPLDTFLDLFSLYSLVLREAWGILLSGIFRNLDIDRQHL